jgi:uncharacterized surface protein with fasciclin (FAS1) repeats
MRSLSLATVALSLVSPAVSYPCSSVISRVTETVSWFTGYGEPIPERFLTRDEYPDTIYRTLKGKQEFSTLVRVIDKFEHIRDELDSDKHLTFFAPTNEALEKYKIPWHEHEHNDQRNIIEATLKYHMIPGVLETRLFGQNSTIATHLIANDGSFDHARRRIKVGRSALPPWTVTLNNYVKITVGDVHAKNGVIHIIDAPLVLPPDIMDIIYMLPTELSITATALLKTNLQSNYEFNSHYDKDKESGKHHHDHHNDRFGPGSPATTTFVPSNQAWERLPEDLRIFLFSPVGERTLRKLMAWHTLPDTVVFTEWARDVKHHHDHDRKKKHREHDLEDPDLGFEWDRHFRSLVHKQKMPVHVKKAESRLPGSRAYTFSLQAHGVYATIIDNPAQNGAFHVVPQVLSPRSVEGVNEAQNEKDWVEWREWLTDWSFEHHEDYSD